MADLNEGLPQPPKAPVGAITAGADAGFNPLAPEPAPPVKAAAELPNPKAEAGAAEESNPGESLEQARERMLRERGPQVSIDSLTRKLEVPALPGYHQHWFLERNIPAALQAWYEFVTPQEQPTLDTSIGGRTKGTTSDDIGGSRVARVAGVNEQGLPEQLVLMKIRLPWFQASQKKLAQRNLSIIQQIFHKRAPVKAPEELSEDYLARYTKEATIDMSNGRFRKTAE